MRWLLIDRIIECTPGVSAVGVKTFPRSDLIFLDHFPDYPIVPGVLQIEMIAQMAGKCAAMARPEILPVLGSVKGAKFYHHVHPGDRCVIKARVTKTARNYILAEGEIEVDSRKVCSAEVFFAVIERARIDSENFDAVTREWLAQQGETT